MLWAYYPPRLRQLHYAYCDRCYEERQNSSIHEYNYKPEPIFYGESKRYFGVELEIDEGGKNSDNADTILGIGKPDDVRLSLFPS